MVNCKHSILRRGKSMEKSKENPREQALRALSEAVNQNTGKFEKAMNRQELNIDKIEAMRSELRVKADGIFNELYDGLVNGIPEKELTVKKRRTKAGRDKS
jgi:hypothetical protein